MSKVLKVIADILIILFILAAAAIFVPPLFGVTTAVATPQVTTNMQQGTVAYGRRVPLEELVSGDSIIYSGDDYALLCEVGSVDPDTDIVTVEADGTPRQIQFHNSAAKTLFTVPVIGYMSIALQTFEGRIILGLIAALIVVLFIVAEVWGNKEKYDREYELEEEEDDDEYFRGLAKNAARGENTRIQPRGTYQEKPLATQPIRSGDDVFAAAAAGIGGAAAAASAAVQADGSVMEQETIKIALEPVQTEEHQPDPEEEKKFWQTKEESDAMLEEIAAAQQAEQAEAALAAEKAEKEAARKAEMEAARKAEKEAARKAEKQAKKEARAEEKARRAEEKAEEKAAAAAATAAAAAAATAAASEKAEAVPEQVNGEAGGQPQLYERLRAEGEDFSDIDDSQMANMESALETALARAGENDHVDHTKTAAFTEAEASGTEEPQDEIELAIPVRSLEEILQDAYSNGEDPHIRKDAATGITLVDFSGSFTE